jgi:ribonuclease HII
MMATADKRILKLQEKYFDMSVYEMNEWRIGNILVAGIDEAGRGPLAGPVVAAACILNHKDPILGLNDSKKLSEKKRDELYLEIKERAVAFSIVRVEHDVIDDINILNATKKAMHECIAQLQIKPDKILIDAVNLNGTGYDITPIIKGDTLSVSIAAASILAKVTRDNIMKEYDMIYPGYGFAQNKGYGTSLHYEGIKKQGATPIHRRTFLKGII